MSKHDLAFPIRIDNGADEPTNHPGLTKLEYAAIQIAHGLAARPAGDFPVGGLTVAQVAAEMADDLLDELESREERNRLFG